MNSPLQRSFDDTEALATVETDQVRDTSMLAGYPQDTLLRYPRYT